MKKDAWKDYFSFSKKERIAVTILLVIISIFIILPYLYVPTFIPPVEDKKLEQQLVALQPAENNYYNNNNASAQVFRQEENEITKAEFFYFDPNLLNANDWKRLGVKERTIQTIINYRNKGGQFRKPEDIRKIYGLRKDQADALIPYIKIQPPFQKEKSPDQPKEFISKSNNTHQLYIQPIKKIDINTATTEEWKSLPGIGEVLSVRIVKFRNAIHGFKSISDIKRTYGLRDSTYQAILPYLIFNDSTFSKN